MSNNYTITVVHSLRIIKTLCISSAYHASHHHNQRPHTLVYAENVQQPNEVEQQREDEKYAAGLVEVGGDRVGDGDLRPHLAHL